MSSVVVNSLFWYSITVKEKPGDYPVIEHMMWTELPFNTRIKFDWYFRYRAALLQIKYPKFIVSQDWGSQPMNKQQEVQSNKNKIRAKKGKITEMERKLELAKKTWTEIFPIEEDPLFLQAVAKIDRLKHELKQLELCQ